jgi:hypothetical protein
MAFKPNGLTKARVINDDINELGAIVGSICIAFFVNLLIFGCGFCTTLKLNSQTT